MKRIVFLAVSALAFQLSFAQWTTSGANIYNSNSGNVGIGTTSPQAKLHVFGTIKVGSLTFISEPNNGLASVFANNLYSGVSNNTLVKYQSGDPGNYISMRYDRGITFGTGVISTAGAEVPDNTNERMRIDLNGNIGIGTASPEAKLHVQTSSLGYNSGDRVNAFTLGSDLGANRSSMEIYTYRNASGSDWLSATTRIQQRIDDVAMGYIEFNPPGMIWGMALGTGNQNRLYINGSGQVGIGTVSIKDANYKLFVETGIRTRKVKVDQTSWPDYVFHSAYQLPSLAEVEQFIQQHKHLPEVPSAKEVEKEGLDLGENQAVLLKKIEELTLYVIEQNKRIEKVELANKELSKENADIKEKLKKISH